MKKNSKNKTGKHVFLKILKIAAMSATICISFAMPVLSGAGLIYNRESYGSELEAVGVFLIVSAAMMMLGVLAVFFRKKIPNIAAVILSSGGFALCMAMLHKLAVHADKSGWSDKYTMAPISSMYRSRLIPCVIPVMLVIITAAVQLLSPDCAEMCNERRRIKKADEDASAPSVLGDDE